MSINVEILGGSMIVQHCVEEIGQPDHLRLVSTSDVFTPAGRMKIGVIWDLAAKEDRRQYLRVHKHGSKQCHAGVAGLPR
jgi:hypothetical protein